MLREPISVGLVTPVLEVQHLCVVADLCGVPVVDALGRVRGFITRTDLLRTIDQACDDDLDETGLTAIDIASPEVVWVLPSATLDVIAKAMHTNHTQYALVGDHGIVVGLVTTSELLAAIAAKTAH